MQNIGQNTMTPEMIDSLYKKANVGKDKFETRIEELEEISFSRRTRNFKILVR